MCWLWLRLGANFLELRHDEVRRISPLRSSVNKASRRPEPLRTPAQVSRIGYFRLATLLRLAQLVPDIRLDSPGASLPHYLGGGLLVCCDLDDLPRVVYPRYMERDQGSTPPQGAHLHAYVLEAFVLVHEKV